MEACPRGATVRERQSLGSLHVRLPQKLCMQLGRFERGVHGLPMLCGRRRNPAISLPLSRIFSVSHTLSLTHSIYLSLSLSYSLSLSLTHSIGTHMQEKAVGDPNIPWPWHRIKQDKTGQCVCKCNGVPWVDGATKPEPKPPPPPPTSNPVKIGFEVTGVPRVPYPNPESRNPNPESRNSKLGTRIPKLGLESRWLFGNRIAISLRCGHSLGRA